MPIRDADKGAQLGVRCTSCSSPVPTQVGPYNLVSFCAWCHQKTKKSQQRPGVEERDGEGLGQPCWRRAPRVARGGGGGEGCLCGEVTT